MTLRLHGEPTSGDSYSLSVASVSFGSLTRARADPPDYPHDALRAGLGARVVLYLLIDADGKVIEAMAGQTSLDKRARNEHEAEAWRDQFEKASIRAAKLWRYSPSEFVNDRPMSRRYAVAPIVFSIGRHASIAYLPGPIHPAPWQEAKTANKAQERFAQLSDGETASTDTHFHLKDDVVGKKL